MVRKCRQLAHPWYREHIVYVTHGRKAVPIAVVLMPTSTGSTMLMTSFTPSFSLSLSLSPLPPPVSMLVLRHHQVMSRPQMSLLLRRQQLVCGVACVRAWMRRCVGACMRGCVHSCSSNPWYVEDSANCVCVCVCLCTYARACVCVPPPPPLSVVSEVVPVFLSLTR